MNPHKLRVYYNNYLRFVGIPLLVIAIIFWARAYLPIFQASARVQKDALAAQDNISKTLIEAAVFQADMGLKTFCLDQQRPPSPSETDSLLESSRSALTQISYENIRYTGNKRCTGTLNFTIAQKQSFRLNLPLQQIWSFPK